MKSIKTFTSVMLIILSGIFFFSSSPNFNVEAEKNVETVETSQTTASAYETTTSVVNVDTIVEGTSETTTDVSKETFSSNDQNIAFVYNDFSWGSGAYSYSGIYVTENGDVYKFAINNHESWTYRTFDFEYVPVELYGYADLSDAFPQTSMLQELNSATYEKVGNISTEEVDYYLDLLYSVDENQDVICEYRDEDNVLPYSETWGVRKSDGKVIFLNGGDDIYLTRTDENSDIIDKWLTSLANNYITSEVDTIFSTATTVTTTFSTTTTLTTTENMPNPDTITTTTDSTDPTITTTKSTTTIATNDGATEATNTTTPTHIASDEELCDWVVKDYEHKNGIAPANAEIEYIAEGTAVIMLTDVEGNVLDIYTIDPTTGIGKASDGGTVDLPQTGYSNTYKVIIGFAILMTMGGTVIVAKSRRKRTSHS